MARRVLDVFVAHVGLDGARIPAIVRQLKNGSVAQHGACTLMPRLASTPARSTMRLKPGAISGAPRANTFILWPIRARAADLLAVNAPAPAAPQGIDLPLGPDHPRAWGSRCSMYRTAKRQ